MDADIPAPPNRQVIANSRKVREIMDRLRQHENSRPYDERKGSHNA